LLEALDNVAPGVNSGDTLLYGMEVKNLFAIGDGAGVTRGLVQASISGVIAAREILRRAVRGNNGPDHL
jgi:uncharacterized FAD-dependent dehydrogenase